MKKINARHIVKTADGFSLTLFREYRAVFGFGEKFDSVNQKGKLVRACIRGKRFNQGECTYLSMPFFLTPDGFGIFVDTYVEVDFDFRRDGELTITYGEGSRGEGATVWYFEATPKEILAEFRSVAGMPRVFPKWVLGSWMSANRWTSQEEVERQHAMSRKWNFPHNVLVLEHWSDENAGYLFRGTDLSVTDGSGHAEYSEMRFGEIWPDPRAMIHALHAGGVRVILRVEPYMHRDGDAGTASGAQSRADSEYAAAHGECVKGEDGAPYPLTGSAHEGDILPDFTNPAAAEHWFSRFAYLRDMGVDGFKTDGGEIVFDGAVTFFDGTTEREGNNRYAEIYTEGFAQFVGETGIVCSRAGGQRSPSFSVTWAGEQESTWAEFAAVIKAGLSASFSGVSLWGFDIAGFAGYLPSKELYLRAVQTAAFVPVMQWNSYEGDDRCDFTGAWKIGDRSPWNIAAYHKDGELLDNLRTQFFLHYNLMPYFYHLMKEAGKTGVPILRHLALEFPEDEAVYGMDDEFMLGDALLVAPVLRDYVATRKVYLPRGRWYDLFTGALYGGGWHEIKLDKRHLPVFMRDNCCVALNLKDGKLCSDVGCGLESYCELVFLVTGEGARDFADDLGNAVSLVWNPRESYARKNKTNVRYRVLRLGRDKIYG